MHGEIGPYVNVEGRESCCCCTISFVYLSFSLSLSENENSANFPLKKSASIPSSI